jgi:hypothetical protein
MCFIARPEASKHALKNLFAILGAWSIGVLSNGISPASAAELIRSADVAATPAMVWSTIGPFCAIKDWHPLVGTCTDDGKVPPTRTLVTKDGKVTFVETQVARNDVEHTYSYNFVSSPFPVTQYVGTIKVAAKGNGVDHHLARHLHAAPRERERCDRRLRWCLRNWACRPQVQVRRIGV